MWVYLEADKMIYQEESVNVENIILSENKLVHSRKTQKDS